jgi:hypothetical protein
MHRCSSIHLKSIFSFFVASVVVLFVTTSASASNFALMNLNHKLIGNAFPQYGATYGDVGNPTSSPILATIGSTAGTPTVMWGAGQASDMITITSMRPPATPISNRTVTWTDKGGSLGVSAGTPSAHATNIATAVTSVCLGGYLSAPLPNACIGRQGSMSSTPGSKKYGGAAQLLRRSAGSGTFVSGLGTSSFYFQALGGTAPPQLGSSRNEGFVKLYDGAGGTNQYSTNARFFGGGYTTGTVMASNTLLYSTSTTGTGSFNLNTTNLTGTISVVVPRLYMNNAPDGAGGYAGSFAGTGTYAKFTLTFLPEPGQMAMLGSGALMLTGLIRVRRRGSVSRD